MAATCSFYGLLIAGGLSVVCSACGDSTTSAPPAPPEPGPATLAVAPDQITLDVIGATVQYTATVWDGEGRVLPDATVTWYTSDDHVVTISEAGLATAVGDGTATVLAAASDAVFGWGEVTVTATPLKILTAGLRPGVVGIPYSQTLLAEGVAAPHWSVTQGALPAGLTLDPDSGVISGTPEEAGESYFAVQVEQGTETVSKDLVIAISRVELGVGFSESEFSLIPAGSFLMGSDKSYSLEKPVHLVNITVPFMIQKTEVTQYQWQTVMGGNPSGFANCGDLCPVERVSWQEAQLFLATLNEMDPGKNYRLPTEAQWEYAARAGTTGDFGGTGIPEEMGWTQETSFSITHAVAQKAPNHWGLYDMHGNVGEWVQDWAGWTYYGESPADDPTGPQTGTFKVYRGGDATQPSRYCTSWRRRGQEPYKLSAVWGFRIVRDPDTPSGT